MNVYYRVTVRVAEGIPQLFSAALGNTAGRSSARATAAVGDAVTPGSLYALNRERDNGPEGQGVDLFFGGGGYAGESNGGNDVYSSFTDISGDGGVENTGTYHPQPTSGRKDLPFYEDPMRDRGQPQPPTLAQAPVWADTQIAGGFGNHVFFGGLHFPSTQTTVSVNPGRYVRAGALSGTPVFYVHNGVTLMDQTSLDANGICPNSGLSQKRAHPTPSRRTRTWTCSAWCTCRRAPT